MKGLRILSVCLAAGMSVIAPALAQDQRQKSDMGIFGGGSFYLGDLNPYTPYKCTHLAGGVFLRQNFNKRISLRYAVNYGTVSANDAASHNEYQQQRNLSFMSPLLEFAATCEINFISFKVGDKEKYYATPYIFFGLGLTHINPQAQLGNTWFELQPLGTEGQGSALNNHKKYALNQLVIPLGLGFKGNLSKHFILGFDFGIRKMFTDYLDDVSGEYQDPIELSRYNGPLAAELADRSLDQESYVQPGRNRGNAITRDWYSFSGMTLSYVIGKDNPCPGWKKKRGLW